MTGSLEFSPRTIAKAWKAEGRQYRPQDVTAEFKRRSREVLRDQENAILVAAEQPGADALTVELAAQIREHRAVGKYTTQG